MRTKSSAVRLLARSNRLILRSQLGAFCGKYNQPTRLRLERLEDRSLMTADVFGGIETDLAPMSVEPELSSLAQAPLTSLPQLHSNANATAKLVLDFDGRFESSWGSYTNVTTPVFDQDGDPTTFSAGELAAINEIWARVAEDYAPFNIDVTTVDPGNETNRATAIIAIGGSYTDWYGTSCGGVSYVGGFYSLTPNVGYVFAKTLSNNTKYIAEATAHESGHLFGLQHQASYSGTTLTNEYNAGNGAWAPLMGNAYNATRTTWYNGPTIAGSTSYQDDMAILSGATDGFGYRADDFASTITTASALPAINNSINFSGIIEQANDVDVWSFNTTGGTVSFQLTGAQYGSNLDAILELRDASGTSILLDSPSNSQGASLSTTLAAGTYYLVARSVGDYGDVGQYTITGSLPAAATTPEISVAVGGVDVADGGSVTFGSTLLGTALTKTFTVANQGTGVLTLTPINGGALPTGFSLISNLSATSLNPGESTTFVIRLDASSAGMFSGTIHLVNDDADENPYDLVFSGTVTAPEIAIDISGAGVSDGQTVSFGSTTLGQSVTRTFTVTNTGNAPLLLTSLSSASMPSGFTLVTNIGSTSLAAGQSTTFSVRLNATSAGSFSGAIHLLNNDSDESSFDITLTGTVAAPEIAIGVSGVDLTSGQTIDFGNTLVGKATSRTFTVTNTGTATLTLTSVDPAALVTGFTLVSNLGSTSLAAGQSTTFCVRLDATAVGNYSSTLNLVNNDSDENPFVLVVSGVVQAPAISVALGATNLSSGQTVDFGTTLVGSAVSRTFTVSNSGTSLLTVTSINPATLPAGYSLVSNLTATSLAVGQSATFTIQFAASTSGTFDGSLVVANDDPDESGFAIQLHAIANVPPPPHLTLTVAGQMLALGGTVDFGTTVTGSTLERTIWIQNDGGTVLTLSPIDPSSLPSGFSLFQGLTTTTLAPGEETSFILRLNADSVGTFSGQITLGSNDPNGSDSFTVTGTVVDPTPPLVQVLDDGDAGTALKGTWQRTAGKGYAADIHTASKGSGQAFYAWNFYNLPSAQYQVWATWTKASTNATNAPYSIFDGGTKLTQVGVNQRLAPGGLNTGGTNWKLLATVTINNGQLTVKLTNAANGTVVADAVRIERVIPVLAPTAEIDLLSDTTTLVSGSSTVDFGSPDIGDAQVRTFTIVNTGTGSLTLTSIDPSSLPTGFSLIENLGSTFLTPGESTTFEVQLDANATGTFTGSISVASDAAGASSFTFQLTGTVYDPAAPVTRIIDDGSPGNSRSGSWTHVTSGGYSKDQFTAAAGKGTSVSTWTFGNLANGDYRIQATWKPASNDATNAPFSLFNGSQLVSTIRINERQAPNDQWDGGWFENLGTIAVTGHNLVVKLTNAANGVVVADAIRIEKILPAGAAQANLPSSINADSLLSGILASGHAWIPDAAPLPTAMDDSNPVTLPLSARSIVPNTPVLAASESENLASSATQDPVDVNRRSDSDNSDSYRLLAHDLALQSLLETGF